MVGEVGIISSLSHTGALLPYYCGLEEAKDSMMLSKKVQHGLSYLRTCMSLRTVTIFSILTRKAESKKQCTSKSTSNIFLASLKLSRLLT